jgi:hypothetical protein
MTVPHIYVVRFQKRFITEFVPEPEKPVGREGLKRKSFFAARRQKRLERKARFLARERQKRAQIFLTC